jgi:hypothetical protein
VHGEQLQGEIPRQRSIPLVSAVFHGFHIHDGSVCACCCRPPHTVCVRACLMTQPGLIGLKTPNGTKNRRKSV